MSKRVRQSGFTTLELVFITVIIGILLTLLITTRAGIQENQRNTERQHDIKELRDGLEGYFAAFNHYPTLAELNDDTWRGTHLKALEADAFRDPSGNDAKLTEKPTAKHYSYSVTSVSGTPCDTAKNPCTQYTLTTTLEGGGTFSKNSLN
jgi:type II secretory pathway pseudopilin PulG